MPNKKPVTKSLVKISAIILFIFFLVAAYFIFYQPPNSNITSQNNSLENRNSRTIESRFKDLINEESLESGKAIANQIKSGGGNQSAGLFSANQAFSANGHKISADYLTPQSPQVTRAALAKLKELKTADLKAVASKQTFGHKTRNRPAESSSDK